MTAGEVTGAAVSPGNGEPAGGGGSAQKARRGRSSLAVPQLEVGMRVMRRWGDQELHPVTIVERRRIPFCGDNYEYYIRYNKLNRRHDEWVKLEQLDLDTLETDIDEKVDNEGSNLKITRERKRKMAETHVQGYKYLDTESVSKHQERTKVKNIIKIELGRYEIDTWYFSPFPSGYNDTPKLFFCEFCLSFMKRKEQLQRHMRKCDLKHPPGNEIYRNGSLSMFEVDGKKFKVYCQNLCYLAKLFLDQKTLYYDVDVFLFYILCECDDRGCHLVGYFSKERKPVECNLACLLTLPPYQRKGYGKFLIAFSYELSKKEGKVGTPEEPLSDLGQVTYTRYWSKVLLDILKKHKGNISVKELSCMTSISSKDISDTLKTLNLTHYCWKGERMVCPDPKIIDEHLKTAGRGGLQVDISKLKWTPHKWRD